MSTPKTSEQKAEFKKDNQPHVISYRLTEEDYRETETLAGVQGISVNELCRKTLVAWLQEGRGMTLNERLIYEEIARLRFVTGQCFKLLASDELDKESWEKVLEVEGKKGKEIADNLLRRAMASGGARNTNKGGEEDGEE
ncbi:MAG: hypothetical protein H0T92_06120 [Pyrinomonadaceae bacterium]|nr:hypothetical protein [Pyrinomonadaceae bacterium]